MTTDVTVPDIGDFNNVPVVTILVSVGDRVAIEDPLLELESDKATMEVPSPMAGVIKEIKVVEGDTVSMGSVIMVMDAEGDAAPPAPAPVAEAKAETPDAAAAPAPTAPVVDSGFSKSHASPSVRAFARQLDIDIAKVNGTGID